MMNSDQIEREKLVEKVSRYRQANHARHMQRYVKCCARRASEEIIEQTTVEEFLEDTPCEFEVNTVDFGEDYYNHAEEEGRS